VTNLLQFARSSRYADLTHSFAGNTYWGMPLPSWKPNEESIGSDFMSLVQNGYQANGIVFACEMTRLALFSEARFKWRNLSGHNDDTDRPGDLFRNPDLRVLEKPWAKGTTGDLLGRMLLDADFAGSSYIARRNEQPDRLMRMRPDWTVIVLGSQDEPDEANLAMDAEVLGYIYHPGGIMTGHTAIPLLADEVCHFAPIPDPLATYRGMSWLAPIVREMQSDAAATMHKLMFFQNGGTPQMVVTMGPEVTPENLQQYVAKMDSEHAGWENAYKTLYLGGGADATVVGKDLAQLDFKVTQGAGETRIAAASGVHPVIAGLSEGLAGSSLNEGNFRSAARLVADRTLRPLWRNAAGSLEDIVPAPDRSELWYDDRDIAFLQENRKDAAEIQSIDAQAIRALVDAQFTPESVVAAVVAQDMTLLKHTGIPTVQGQQAAQLPPTNGTKPAALAVTTGTGG
jgi:phage portal protein BeeE